VDFKNAFKSIYRSTIMDALEQRCLSMQAFQPAPVLVGCEVIWSTRGVQQGDPLGPFLLAAGILAAVDALPPGGALHRWYLDDRVFMGSMAEVEGALTALQQTLLPLGPELNLRKTTVWGPGLVPAASPLAAAMRLHMEGGTEVLGVPIHSPLYPSPERTHLGTLKGKFARTCAAVAALADTQSAHALMRSCLGPAKVQYALRTLPIHHTADVTVTQQATWDAVVGTPTSDAAWVQTTLPLSEGGCGVSNASDVAPVARLAGVMQFLARAEPLLGCDRQLVVPLATEAGLLDALNARLPPPWNHCRAGRARARWNCPMGTCDVNTGGQPFFCRSCTLAQHFARHSMH